MLTSRARLVTLCALLSLPPLGGAVADPAIKPAIVGLISTGNPDNRLAEFAGLGGIFGGVVLQARWVDLQPDPSMPLVTAGIDSGLKAVRTYNSAKGLARKLGVRLRVFAGCSAGANGTGVSDAPMWAMNLDGGPITATGNYVNGPETCTFGRFWDPTSRYATAWAQLQAQLAAKYDTAEPLIQEVAVTSCTSFSGEPFFLPQGPTGLVPDTSTQTVLPKNYGYQDAQYQGCLMNAVADYSQWKTTRLEFTFLGFSGLSGANDIAFSERVMRGCRQLAGPRCILSGHDLDAQTPAVVLPVYALERKFGPNITFQSLYGIPVDPEGTIRKGISLGAGAIEIWPKGFAGGVQSAATLESWAEMFTPQ